MKAFKELQGSRSLFLQLTAWFSPPLPRNNGKECSQAVFMVLWGKNDGISFVTLVH